MPQVNFRTNLDLANETWCAADVPRIGDRVRSMTVHEYGLDPKTHNQFKHRVPFRLELEVVRVTWEATFVEVELHHCHKVFNEAEGKMVKSSVTQFYDWYAPLVGKSISSFI